MVSASKLNQMSNENVLKTSEAQQQGSNHTKKANDVLIYWAKPWAALTAKTKMIQY